MSEELTCTKCRIPIAPGKRLGTVEEPYCLKCWLITYYDMDKKEIARMEAEAAGLLKKGIPAETVNKLVLSTLRQKQKQIVLEGHKRMQPLIDSVIATRDRLAEEELNNMRLRAVQQTAEQETKHDS